MKATSNQSSRSETEDRKVTAHRCHVNAPEIVNQFKSIAIKNKQFN